MEDTGSATASIVLYRPSSILSPDEKETGHAKRALCAHRLALFPQPKPPDDLLISRAVLVREILQQTVALADHLQQPATRGVILLVRLEMLGQLIDPLRQDRDLHFRRSCVFIVNAKIADDLAFRLVGNGHDNNTP